MAYYSRNTNPSQVCTPRMVRMFPPTNGAHSRIPTHRIIQAERNPNGQPTQAGHSPCQEHLYKAANKSQKSRTRGGDRRRSSHGGRSGSKSPATSQSARKNHQNSPSNESTIFKQVLEERDKYKEENARLKDMIEKGESPYQSQVSRRSQFPPVAFPEYNQSAYPAVASGIQSPHPGQHGQFYMSHDAQYPLFNQPIYNGHAQAYGGTYAYHMQSGYCQGSGRAPYPQMYGIGQFPSPCTQYVSGHNTRMPVESYGSNSTRTIPRHGSLPLNSERKKNGKPWATVNYRPAESNDILYSDKEDVPPWQKQKSKRIMTFMNTVANGLAPKPQSEPEWEKIIEIQEWQLDVENNEDKVQFVKYNDLGFEEDASGRVICYVQARSLPDYSGKMKTGLGIFFSPLHPCNLSVRANLATTESNGGMEAAAKAIDKIWQHNLEKIAICTDSQYLLGCLLLPKKTTGTMNEQDEIRLNFMDQVRKGLKVSIVPLVKNYNEVYKSEARYLANLAAGLSLTPPPSLIQNHVCTEEKFQLGDVVSLKLENLEENTDGIICEGLYRIMSITQEPTVYCLESLLRDEVKEEPVGVLAEDLHLVKKREILEVNLDSD